MSEQTLVDIQDQLNRSAVRLAQAVREKYRLGAIVQAKTAHGHVITAEVIGHGHSWHDPECIRVRNVVTGGEHSLSFRNIGPDEVLGK